MHTEGHAPRFEKLRLVGSFAALVVIGLLATGCGKTSSASSASSQIQVRIWRIDQPEDPIKSEINSFVSANSGLVNVTYTSKPLDGYELSSLKSLAAQNGPDIWSIPDDWLGDHTVRIAPLPTDFYDRSTDTPAIPNAVDAANQLYPAGIAKQIISTDGKSVLGVPTNVDVLRLYYNPNLFSTALQTYRASLGNNYSDAVYNPVQQLLSSPPTTWTDVTNMVKYLTVKNGNTISQGAIALGTADNISDSNDILQLLMLQNGTKIVSDDRTRTLFQVPQTLPAGGTVRPGQNALDFFTSFSQPGNANYSWNPSMPDELDAFAQGKVAMVLAYSDFGASLKEKYPRFSFSQAPAPQVAPTSVQPGVDFIKFDVETITKAANNYDAAQKMLHRYADPNDVEALAQQAGLSTPYLADLKDNSSFPNAEIIDGQTVWKKDRTDFDAAFRQMIIDVSQNGISSSDAIDSASDTINQLLASPDE